LGYLITKFGESFIKFTQNGDKTSNLVALLAADLANCRQVVEPSRTELVFLAGSHSA
jgi:hypothetical protein